MNFKLFAIAASLTISLSVVTCLKGQDTTKATKITSMRYVQVSFSPGYFRSYNQEFNKDLQSEGFNKISSNMLNMLISLEFFFNKRFVMGPKVQCFTLTSAQEQPNGYDSYLSGYSYGMSMGYILIKKAQTRFYVYGGPEMTHATFRIKDPDFRPFAKSNTVGTALSTPPRDLKYPIARSFLFNFGFSLERMVDLPRNKFDCSQNTRYLILGVKVGYSPQASVSPNPISGLYTNLSLGFGTKMKRVRWI